MTGWGMGYCSGTNAAEAGPPAGPGLGWRWGGGRGFGGGRGGGGFGGGRGGHGHGWRHRHQYYATGLTGWQRARMGWSDPDVPRGPAPSREEELGALRQQAADLEQALGELRARMEDLAPPAGRAAPATDGGER